MIDNAPYINIHTHKWVENELTISARGIHPFDALSGSELLKEDFDSSIEAVGEIGLDFSIDTPREVQEQLFIEQLQLADQLGLPVVLHSVRAVDRTLEILSKFTSLRAVIFHGFIGSTQQAKRATDRGYFLSFGHRCFASPKTLEALRTTPLDNLFFETDDHDISIEEIYHAAESYRPESLDEIRKAIYINYIKIFKK